MNLQELKALLEELCSLPSETEWVEFKEAKNNIHFDDLGKYFSDNTIFATGPRRTAVWALCQ